MRRMTSCVGLVMVISLLAAERANTAPVLWDPAGGGNGHYYEVITATLDWMGARTAAQAISAPVGYQTGQLASIESAAESSFILGLSGFGDAWIGATDLPSVTGLSSDQWCWLQANDGTTMAYFYNQGSHTLQGSFTYANWNTGEPNGSGTGEAVGQIYGATGKWNDLAATSRTQTRYIVEWLPLPDFVTSQADGWWDVGTTWDSGAVPNSTTNIAVKGGFAVDVRSNGNPNQAGNLAISEGGSRVDINPGAQLIAGGISIGDATLRIGGSASAGVANLLPGGRLEFYGNGQLTADSMSLNGTLAFDSGTNATITVNTRLDVSADANVSGQALSVATAAVNLLGGTLTSNGNMAVSTLNAAGGSLNLGGHSALISNTLAVGGNSTVNPAQTLLTNASSSPIPTISLNSGTLTYNAALEANTVSAGGGGLNLSDNNLKVNNTLTVAANFDARNTTLIVPNATVSLNGGTLTYDRALSANNVIGNGGSLDMQALQLNVTGRLTINDARVLGTTGRVVANALTLNGSGTLNANGYEVEITGGGSHGGSSGTIGISGTGGALRFSGGGTLNVGTLNFTNAGDRMLGGTMLPAGSQVGTVAALTGSTLTSGPVVTGSNYTVSGGTANVGHDMGTAEVTSGTLNLTADISATAINQTGGEVRLLNGSVPSVAFVNLTGGTFDTGTQAVEANTLKLGTLVFAGSGAPLRASSTDLLGGPRHLTLLGGTVQVQDNNAHAMNQVRGSIFNSTPGNETPLNLDGARYEFSGTRVLTGDKSGTILALAESPANNEIVTARLYATTAGVGWTDMFPNYTTADNFVTAFSGRFFPQTTGSYQLRANCDDRGLMYIDMNDDGIFQRSDRVGPWDWYSTGSKTLEAGRGYNFVIMSQEFTGGESVNWWITPPAGGEVYIEPGNAAQAGWWASNVTPGTIHSPQTHLSVTASTTLDANTPASATFGDLNVRGGTVLTLSGAPGGFSFGSLAGGGAIDGSLAARSGIAPGDSVGTLAVNGHLTLENGTIYQWDLGPDGNDVVNVTGTLTLGDWTLAPIDLGTEVEVEAEDVLALFTGFSDIVWDPSRVSFDLDAVSAWLEFTNPARLRVVHLLDGPMGEGLYLTGLANVPEPSTIVLGALGLLALTLRRRRRS
ncbi:MAG: PEP-CTERM sorting domain-containing protein [Patescibacteria group bacterium]|nr:PEP-CTERM sorting domain-containing protein [Patescibacteria group bacterium]